MGHGPITGGLFLGSDADAVTNTGTFAVSQDQRNTARARVRFQAPRRVWLAMGATYGSGLPVDTADTDANDFIPIYGAAIVDRVNLARGRVRPSLSLDTAAGVEL